MSAEFVDYGDDWYGVQTPNAGIPEGSAASWWELLDVVSGGGVFNTKRLAGVQIGEQVLLWSPRNTTSVDMAVTVLVSELREFVDAMPSTPLLRAFMVMKGGTEEPNP